MTYLLPDDQNTLRVDLDADHLPVRFHWRQKTYVVRKLVNEWRVDDGWWHHPVSRHYFQVSTTTGLLVIFYWDRFGRSWHLERLQD